jgi:hypothetical protein
MRRRARFTPMPLDMLERRVVLSHGALALQAALGGAHPRPAVHVDQQQSITSEIDQAFGLFQNDYSQARATYLTSIQGQANPSTATTAAFSLYTTQRVGLLAQQLLSDNVPKRLVGAKIIGARQQEPPGSLVRSLLDTIPQPGTTAPTVSLYSLGQDNSIEAAQIAILHGIKHT